MRKEKKVQGKNLGYAIQYRVTHLLRGGDRVEFVRVQLIARVQLLEQALRLADGARRQIELAHLGAVSRQPRQLPQNVREPLLHGECEQRCDALVD